MESKGNRAYKGRARILDSAILDIRSGAYETLYESGSYSLGLRKSDNFGTFLQMEPYQMRKGRKSARVLGMSQPSEEVDALEALLFGGVGSVGW